MPSTKLDIFQAVCSAVGIEVLPDFENDSDEARVFLINYDRQRRIVLAMGRWLWAEKRARLAETTVDEDTKYPWSHAFRKPGDFIEGSMYTLYNGTLIGDNDKGDGQRLSMINDSFNYEEYDPYSYAERGPYFLTNVDTLDLRYTEDVPVEQFSDLAADLLILKIAIKAAETLANVGSVQDRLKQDLNYYLREIRKEMSPPRSFNIYQNRSPWGFNRIGYRI